MIKYLSKEAFIAALKRAIWTMAEVALSLMSIGMAISDIDWKHVASVTLVAGLISLLKSIVIGMPESDTDGSIVIDKLSDVKENWTLKVDKNPDDISNSSVIRLKVEQIVSPVHHQEGIEE